MPYAPYSGGWQDLPDTSTPITAAALNSISYGYRYVETVYFTSSGTFVKANYPWLRAIRARVQAAGGAGGGAAATGGSQTSMGAGGHGGVYVEKWITNIAGLSASVTVTVGAGGASEVGLAGGNGGDSAFDSTSASGGGGGSVTGPNGNTNIFGTSTGNPTGSANADLVIVGGRRQPVVQAMGGSFADFRSLSGGGGGCFLGPDGGAPINSSGNGSNGRPGCGGSGGLNSQNQATARSGGNGGNGIVIVELYA